MTAPFAVPSDGTLVSSLWRAISSLGFLRRLLGIAKDESALASALRAPVHVRLGTSDGEGPDTSLTQAELEVLK